MPPLQLRSELVAFLRAPFMSVLCLAITALRVDSYVPSTCKRAYIQTTDIQPAPVPSAVMIGDG
jgi:hypothetical protein